MPPLLHAAALARELKISRMSISKALHSGRIAPAEKGPDGRPLFDLETVKRIFVPDPGLTGRPDGLQGGRPGLQKKQGYKNGRPTGEGQPAAGGRPANDDPDLQTQFMEARLARENAVARLKKLELDIKEGRYIEAETARRQGAELGSVLVGAMQAWPARLAPELAAMKDADDFEFESVLVREVNNLIKDIRTQLGL